ncbi:PoNe immunity protein domain-containing protein [Chryseobacterium sp. MIQD13]|uniref:PoNi-like cognate immunity protein n=1 Tax=Chryseobacterium sp. MIQD13 TaxID=3422310 RepID=UPI003D26BD50
MDTRDTLNSQENYQEIIERQKEYILEELEDLKGYSYDDQDKINDTYETIVKYSLDNLIARYSVGEPIESIKKEYLSTLHYYQYSWSQSNGYVSMVWMLSIGIMLEIEQDQFIKLVNCVEKDNPNDFLIDFLISSKINHWEKHNSFKFPKPYENIKEVIDLSKDNREAAIERLLKYLQKEWYRGHSDTGWYDAHKSKWNIHTGYWSFESGAIVKILGLPDNILKDQQYYPYDMVHWQD